MPQRTTTANAAPKQSTGAAAYRQMAEQGVLWTAPSGAVIRVRDLTIADRAVMLAMPQDLQKIVSDIIERSPSLKGADSAETEEELLELFAGEEGGGMTALLEREYRLGVHACIACWIDPQVVLTSEEVTDPDTQISADVIPASDRRAFLTRVFGGNEQEAAALATFRPEPS